MTRVGDVWLVATIIRLQTLCWIAVILPLAAQSQQPIAYSLRYSVPGGSRVHVSLTLPESIPTPRTFVMPRNYPGGYNLVLYDSFVENIRAYSADDKPLSTQKEGEGPRWEIGQPGDAAVRRIEYEVDVGRMEQDLPSAIDDSKVRPGYLGILGYSVFGYVDRLQDRRISLRVDAPPNWPVTTTLAPSLPAPVTTASAEASNYYALADSQILMGPDFQLRLVRGKIPLFLAAYTEGEEDLGLEGQLARQALDNVEAYFGSAPFQHYTIQLELLRPIARHDYSFSQEHLDSGTFSLAVSRAITPKSTAAERQTTLFNYAHHIAHCWIPKRAYGTGYLPFTWEMPPVIDTIWFNEGFARYAAIEALAEAMSPDERTAFRHEQLDGLRRIVDEAPGFIREMPLLVLSREASFMYSLDFRVGMNTFSRGALMAAEMDERIRTQTGDKKSLRDALRFLVEWTRKNQRPFRTEELANLLSEGSGVDVHDIVARWMKPRT
jgi:predicted metalloprotease with PDZ domain